MEEKNKEMQRLEENIMGINGFMQLSAKTIPYLPPRLLFSVVNPWSIEKGWECSPMGH